jgi:hypothetical protein
MLGRLGALGGTQAEEVHEGRTRGDGLRVPTSWVLLADAGGVC